MGARSSGVEAVAIYGIDAQGIAAMDVVAQKMTSGSIDALDTTGGGRMGSPLAMHLGLAVGDPVTLDTVVTH
jgi:ABC-type lipoprotein release transport system permease subunit